MEVNASQRSCSTPKYVKRIGPDVKDYLEKWYEAMGKPKALTLGEKTLILHEIKSRIEPRRKSEGAPASPRHRRIGMGIYFISDTHRYRSQSSDDPGWRKSNPSPDLLTVWVESPSLPNVTLQDAHRFVKYNQAQMQSNQNEHLPSPASKYALHQDAATGDSDESDEEDMLDDESYFLTAETLPPVLEPHAVKPNPCLSPKLHPETHDLGGPRPMSSSPPMQLPPDRRALLEILRFQLSIDELKALLQESNVKLVPRTPTPSVEPAVFDNLPRPEGQPLSQISPLLFKSSRFFAHTHLSSPGEISISSYFTKNLARTVSADASSDQTHVPYSTSKVCMSSPGIIPNNILRDLSKLYRTASAGPTSPENAIRRFELCQKRSEELLAALERGVLRSFGMVPNKELKDLGLPRVFDLPSYVASS